MVSFPHPVLGSDDDVQIGSTADVSVSCVILDERVTLEIAGLRTSNETIDELIESGKAEWKARVQCARTYYRDTKSTSAKALTVSLDGRRLSGTVTVDLTLCACDSLAGYLPRGLHPDYHGQAFDLNEGDALALGGHFSFTVDKDFDPLRASAQSIMKVREGEPEYGPFSVDLGGNFIEIYLSKQDWKSWNAMKDHAPALLHAGVVVPALMHALQHLDDHKGNVWADRLELLLHRLSESRSQPPVIENLDRAQALLIDPKGRGPLGRGMDSFLALIDQEA